MKKFNYFAIPSLIAGVLMSSCGTITQPGRTYTVTAADGTRQTIVISPKERPETPATEAKKQSPMPETPKKTDETPQPLKHEEKTDSRADSLIISGDWTIYSVRGNLVTGEERPYFTLDLSAGRFYGSNGCNILNGDVVLSHDRGIRFDHTIATMKMCADAQYEYLINLALNDIRSYSIRKETPLTFLDLKNAQGQTILVFRRHNMEFLNGAWRVTNINGQEVTKNQPTLVVDIPELRIHGKGGCNTFNGNLFIDPDKSESMQFQNISSTRMTCPDIELESRYFLALESVEHAVLNPDGTVTMFDSSHTPILALTPLRLKP